MKVHELKCDTAPFTAVCSGKKRAEFRFVRGKAFKVGDILRLREISGVGNDIRYTDAVVDVRVTHVQVGYGIPDGFAMLSIQRVDP